eukprot:symbB.v1.2.040414.t1/scaffold7214.1/size12608/1
MLLEGAQHESVLSILEDEKAGKVPTTEVPTEKEPQKIKGELSLEAIAQAEKEKEIAEIQQRIQKTHHATNEKDKDLDKLTSDLEE